MAGRSWEPTKKGAKDLNRFIRKGTTVYTIRKTAKNIAPYEADELYAAHTFDWRSPITGNWMTGHLSAEGLLAQEGTVYERKPEMREIGSPGPQVTGPTSQGVLDRLRGGDRAKAGSRR
ncbi:hypothetical protein [Streptomyces cyanogenus]|uniref:Uncharacterized protein n=1 Tax=Streptomyces cyanogenus TaxID=80860 RepID=A0ABX7TN21_STRCY|nr:hypothetical protein [Streptomyces cyanogenus]QTD96993.1 hypothetical protein S1361_06490 [Streptomyces cyanogenus]